VVVGARDADQITDHHERERVRDVGDGVERLRCRAAVEQLVDE
jgi:hypothetical protein